MPVLSSEAVAQLPTASHKVVPSGENDLSSSPYASSSMLLAPTLNGCCRRLAKRGIQSIASPSKKPRFGKFCFYNSTEHLGSEQSGKGAPGPAQQHTAEAPKHNQPITNTTAGTRSREAGEVGRRGAGAAPGLAQHCIAGRCLRRWQRWREGSRGWSSTRPERRPPSAAWHLGARCLQAAQVACPRTRCERCGPPGTPVPAAHNAIHIIYDAT